ncbi:hypothetical protein [Methanobacterium ferruginis]|uniref:hypothetical protein n=1 Tax=Methanobacterium ferruginis TaxID=710191 RepID=UPI002572B05B|nr:hypothetical protein [Methanobacterium ferruginis]BDZ68911.1 hypothetical protein GCM10025860_23590 [Methanobacterium ferruginis]
MEIEILLDYSAYKLIKSFEGYGAKFRFNKFMYLLDNELKASDIDIKLPYYWYRYGVVVNDSEHFFALRESSIDPESIPHGIKNKINKAITKLMKESRFKSTNDINKEIYKKAPFTIQEDFRQLLKIMKPWKEENQTSLNSFFKTPSNDVTVLIKKSLIDYPEDHFSEIYPLFLEWNNYLCGLLNKNYPQKDTALFVDTFWFTFAKKLRLVTEQNIDKKTIKIWEKDYHSDRSKLENYLFDFSFTFYPKYCEQTQSTESNQELHYLASKIIWEK